MSVAPGRRALVTFVVYSDPGFILYTESKMNPRHGMFALFFNTTILALTVNVGAGFF